MPVFISAICIRNTKAEEFLQSSQYLDLKEDISKQRMESDGLYLAMSLHRKDYSDSVAKLKKKDYLYLYIDDEGGFDFEGSFIPSEEFGLATNMSIVAIEVEKENLESYLEYYNYDFLKNLQPDVIQKLKRIFFENGVYRDLMDDDAIEEVEALCPDYDWDNAERKWAYFELGFDTSLSTDSIFLLNFQPTLQNIIKWKSIIDDETDEWVSEYEGNEDKYAYSTNLTINGDLLESLQEQLHLEEGLINYPGIIYFGVFGNAQDGWMVGKDQDGWDIKPQEIYNFRTGSWSSSD